MPAATSVDKAKLDLLYRDACKSVVSIMRYSKEGEYIDFGSGFVLYDDSVKTVILTSSEVFDEDEESIVICFSDGQTRDASVFVSEFNSIYTTLVVDSTGSSDPITFEKTLGRGELVFTISRVLENVAYPGIFTGSVLHPKCVSVSTHTRKPVNRHDDLFAFSCPVAGPCQELQTPATMLRLIGAPVFNMRCQMVGIIERSSLNKYDLKFAKLTGSVNEELKILFGSNDWMAALKTKLITKTSN